MIEIDVVSLSSPDASTMRVAIKLHLVYTQAWCWTYRSAYPYTTDSYVLHIIFRQLMAFRQMIFPRKKWPSVVAFYWGLIKFFYIRISSHFESLFSIKRYFVKVPHIFIVFFCVENYPGIWDRISVNCCPDRSHQTTQISPSPHNWILRSRTDFDFCLVDRKSVV